MSRLVFGVLDAWADRKACWNESARFPRQALAADFEWMIFQGNFVSTERCCGSWRGLGFLKSGGMVCVVFLSFMMSLSAVFYCRLLRADSERSFADGVHRPAFEGNVRKGKYEVALGGCFDCLRIIEIQWR